MPSPDDSQWLRDRPFIYTISDPKVVECAEKFWALGKGFEVESFADVCVWGGGYNGFLPPVSFAQNLAQSAAGVLFYSEGAAYSSNLINIVVKVAKDRRIPLFVVSCDDSTIPPSLSGFTQVKMNTDGLAEIVGRVISSNSSLSYLFREPIPRVLTSSPVRAKHLVVPALKVLFDSEFTQVETLELLTALGDLYRACGGLGLPAVKAIAERSIHEGVDG